MSKTKLNAIFYQQKKERKPDLPHPHHQKYQTPIVEFKKTSRESQKAALRTSHRLLSCQVFSSSLTYVTITINVTTSLSNKDCIFFV